MSKLKSRKLVMAVTTAALVIANEGFDLNIPSEAVYQLVAVVCSYIFGQALVDARRA